MPSFWALLLVSVLAAGGSATGCAALIAPGCGRAPAVGLPCDAIRPCPVMSQLHVETFRARIMIVASFGPHLAVSGHDHGTARA